MPSIIPAKWYSSKHTGLHKNFHKELATRDKLYQWLSLLNNIKTCYKEMGCKADCFFDFFHLPERNLPIETVIPMSRIANHVINETGSKVDCLPGFCHHHLATMSVHTHVHRYCLFESRMKIGNYFM